MPKITFFKGINEWQWWMHYIFLGIGLATFAFLTKGINDTIIMFIIAFFAITIYDRIIHTTLQWD